MLCETKNAVRLFGSAALPEHFPPYLNIRSYRSLTTRRVAAILRNGRRTARYFRDALKGLVAEQHFDHGLYLTLQGRQPLDEAAARAAAEPAFQFGTPGASALILQRRNGFTTAHQISLAFVSRYLMYPRHSGTIFRKRSHVGGWQIRLHLPVRGDCIRTVGRS